VPNSKPERYQLSHMALSLSYAAPFPLIGTSKKIWINENFLLGIAWFLILSLTIKICKYK
jgi:hypothetical protein